MRYQETFELRDNDMVMRELSSSETNEVTGGIGVALVQASSASGAGSSQTVNISALLQTTNTSATAEIVAGITSSGSNIVGLAAVAEVF